MIWFVVDNGTKCLDRNELNSEITLPSVIV